MYLLDTDWIIQALAKREPASRTLYELAGRRVHVSVITVGELYEGAFGMAHPEAELRIVRAFLDQYHVLNLSDPLMERFAEIRSHLRRHGQLIPDFDILIAATAIHHDLALLTFNLRHFRRIPELQLFQAE